MGLCSNAGVSTARFSKLKQPLVVQALNKFAKVNDQRVYKLLRSIMDPQAEYKYVVKAVVSTKFIMSAPQ